jgi:bifunctional oligoribonuclease and PAP phosphatase NrnA
MFEFSRAPSEAVLEQVLRAIEDSRHLLVTAHARPDGDAVGSLLACWMLLQHMGKKADMVLSDRVPVIYRGLPCAGLVRHCDHVEGDYDTVILLECDGIPRARLRGLENRFLINIDHHASGRDFGHINSYMNSRPQPRSS